MDIAIVRFPRNALRLSLREIKAHVGYKFCLLQYTCNWREWSPIVQLVLENDFPGIPLLKARACLFATRVTEFNYSLQ